MSAQTARQIVVDTVEGAGFPAPFQELIILALSQPGRILHLQSRSRFSEFIQACSAASGGWSDVAARTSAAFEMCIAASDVLDEIEDQDESPVVEVAGAARALNATTALLALSHLALCANSEAAPSPELVLNLDRALAETVIASTIGQDQDLSDRGRESTSTSSAVEIARRKSGSLVGGACLLGAMIGTSDPEIRTAYHEFGVHLGTALQLTNDLHDASSSSKSDQSSGARSVPLLFMRESEDMSSPPTSEAAMLESGALHFTWVLIETERVRCDRIIDFLKSRGQQVDYLIPLLGAR